MKRDPSLKSDNLASLEQIDRAFFDGWKQRNVADWYRKNIKSLLFAVRSELNKWLVSEMPYDALPDYLQGYCPKTELRKITQAVKSQKPYTQWLLPGIVAVSLTYEGCSCHDLLFRFPEKAAISQRISYFLTLLKQMPAIDRKRVAKILQDGAEEIHDVLYILKLRLSELAEEIGCDFDEMLCNITVHSEIREKTDAFTKDISAVWKTPVDGMKEVDQNLQKNYVLTIVVYSICTIYNISADRLLLHDYSHIACHPDGTELTAEEQQFLSLFLRANVTTQSLAISEAIASKTGGLQTPLSLTT